MQLEGSETSGLALLEIQLPGAMDGPVAEGSSAGEAEGSRGEGHGVIEEEADESYKGGSKVGEVSLRVQTNCEGEKGENRGQVRD